MRYNAEFSQHLFSTFFFSTELFLKILQESPLLTKNVDSVVSANYHGHRSSSHVTLIPTSNTQYWKKLTGGKDEVIRVSEMCYSLIKQLEREIQTMQCMWFITVRDNNSYYLLFMCQILTTMVYIHCLIEYNHLRSLVHMGASECQFSAPMPFC